MSERIVEQLKQLKYGTINPQTDWVARNRALLLSQIKNTIPERPAVKTTEKMWAGLSIFFPKPLVYNVVRPVAVLLIVALVATTAYSGTVKASYETLPGDWLYPAKRGVEKTQAAVLSVIGDATAQTKLHVEFAKRRAAETKQISGSSDPEKVAKMAVTVGDLQSEMNSINSKLEETKSANGTLQATVAKDIKQNSEQIKNVLQDAKDNLALSPNVENKALSREISETKDLVKDVSVKAVEVLVAKHLEGDTSVSKEEVKQEINNALQTSVNEVGVSKQNVDGAKVILESVKGAVADLKSEAQKQNNSDLVSSTKAFSDKVSTATNQTVAAVLKTEAASAELDKKVSEAHEFLNKDDLAQAVGKMKEANQASKDVEKISDKAIEKTQTILPIVQVMKDTAAAATTTAAGTTLPLLIVTTTPTATMSSTPAVIPVILKNIVSSTERNSAN
ncbi:MAG: hypothetical protein HY983_02655 [Candidatus Magasanikbacteria bacterium]|nr:hypothetical protein [Candidatus Magasanikbacteria bacterium]